MRVALWSTSSLEPSYEAVSKEIFQLRDRFEKSWILAISPHYALRASWRHRYVGVNIHRTFLFRMVIPILERAFDINHVYGFLTPWIFHKTLHRNPIIHTVIQDSAKPVLEFLHRCEAIVVQTSVSRDRMLQAGVPRERVHLWYPGIDLRTFRPSSEPATYGGRPRLLFASSPRTEGEMEKRGVCLLLNTARQFPELQFRFLYRSWKNGYSSYEPTRKAIAEGNLANVELSDQNHENMHMIYPRYDFTVVPYTTPDGGKDCPNSALESLACGVPVLVSAQCPFAQFIRENDCGVVFAPTPESLAAAVEQASERWNELSRAARKAAAQHFDREVLLKRYAALYRRVLSAQPR